MRALELSCQTDLLHPTWTRYVCQLVPVLHLRCARRTEREELEEDWRGLGGAAISAPQPPAARSRRFFGCSMLTVQLSHAGRKDVAYTQSRKFCRENIFLSRQNTADSSH